MYFTSKLRAFLEAGGMSPGFKGLSDIQVLGGG